MGSDFIRRVFARLRFLFQRSAFERELAEEIETHRSLLEQELLQSGLSKREANERSDRALGNVTLAKEGSRNPWHFQILESILQDVRHSARGLLRNPVFFCTAVLSLALGIGANTAIFSAVNTLLFKPLPVSDPASLVTFAVHPSQGQVRPYLPPAFANRLNSTGAFSDVVGTISDGLSFTYDGRAERIMGEVVTPNFFRVLGVSPILGQGFTPGVAGGRWAPEAVLSYSFWKVRFGGDPRIIGRVIRLNTYPFTVVGVSPPSFLDVFQGQDPELRIPMLPPGQELKQIYILGQDQEIWLLGRLAPGVNRVKAQAIADARFREFNREAGHRLRESGSHDRLELLPGDRGWPELVDEYEAPILVLFLMVLVALLIACANVASMLLARATARRHEFAIRSSLGAGRRRLIRQLLIESLLLALSGGLAGLVVARWVAQFLLRFLPQGHIHVVLDLRLDARSLVFTLVLSVAAALLFGFTTSVQSTRGDLAAALKTDSNASVGGSTKLRKALVTFQIAFSLTLLAVAGLFVRTVFNLRPGVDYPQAQKILVFTIKPQREIYSPERIRTVVAEIVRRVAEIPGVQAAGLAENGPFASRTDVDTVQVPGRTPVEVESDLVTPGLFNAIGLPILSGRDFNASDKPGSPKVVILSQRLAQALFPKQSAIGRAIELPSSRGTTLFPLDGTQRFQVVGIVPDVHYYKARTLMPTAFFAFQKDPPYMPTLQVRVASSNARSFIPAISRALDAVDTGFPVFNVRALENRFEDALARERMIAGLSSAFGALALILAAVGLYGVLAYSVARRTRELAVRIALGSERSAVMWLVGREALALVAIGAGAGLLVSIAAGKLLASRLYGVAPADPLTLFTASGALLAVAMAAAAIPALRACRIDPATALRGE